MKKTRIKNTGISYPIEVVAFDGWREVDGGVMPDAITDPEHNGAPANDYPGMDIDANHPGWHPYHPYAVHWHEFGNEHDVRCAPEKMTVQLMGFGVMKKLAALKAEGKRGWAVMLPV